MDLARSGFTGQVERMGMWDQQTKRSTAIELSLQNHHGFFRRGMLFPQQTSYVAKRHCLRWMRHFPERPLTVTNSEAGVGQYEPLLRHRLLRSMLWMAQDLSRLRFTAEHRSGLPESGSGPKKAQQQACCLHREYLHSIEETWGPCLGTSIRVRPRMHSSGGTISKPGAKSCAVKTRSYRRISITGQLFCTFVENE